MVQKKVIKVYRTNLINVGLGQGMMETLPFLAGITEYSRKGLTVRQSSFSAEGLLSERLDIEYDQNDKVVKESYFAEDDEPSEIIEYKRGPNGELLNEIKKYLDGSADVTTCRYDADNRLIEKVTKDDDGVVDRIEKFTWDENRMITREVTDGDGEVLEAESFLYDDKGNVLEHRKESGETGEDFKTVRQYDEAGRKTMEQVYDGEGNLLESARYTLDESGRVISSQNESPRKQSETKYFYDENGNHLGQEETTTEGHQVLWVEHNYDEQHNLSRSVIFIHGGTRSPGQHYALDYSYEWYTD